MKLSVSSSGQSLDAQVDPRFGRCAYFAIIETEGDEIISHEIIENESAGARRGAGIQAAQTIANKGADVTITGNVGPNAFNALSSAGVKVVAGASGSVKDAVEAYLRGELKETSEPTNKMGKGRRGGGRR